MNEDVKTFARLACQARADAHASERRKAKVLAPQAKGISRFDLQARLRREHKVEWTLDRLTAVVTALVGFGALKPSKGGGFCAGDWLVMEALANGEAA